MSGVDLIAAERARQIQAEGFDAEHDRQEKPGALTMAGICYATMAASSPGMRDQLRTSMCFSTHWPWTVPWWKPGKDNSNEDRIRELTKAGALMAAEIDRLEAIDREGRTVQ